MTSYSFRDSDNRLITYYIDDWDFMLIVEERVEKIDPLRIRSIYIWSCPFCEITQRMSMLNELDPQLVESYMQIRKYQHMRLHHKDF